MVAAAGLTPVNQPFTHLLYMPYMASSRFEVPFMACCEVRYAVQKNRTNVQDNRAESFHGTAPQIDQCAVDVGVGCSVRTIARIESGSGAVRLETFAMYLEALGMLQPFEYLTDTANDGLGIALMDEQLPKRIRRKSADKASGSL